MESLKARVHDGRLVLDEPTDLPEGTEVELVPVEAFDGLDDDERRRLHAELHASLEEAERGELRPAREVLAELFGTR